MNLKIIIGIMLIFGLLPMILAAEPAFTFKQGEASNITLQVLNEDNSVATASVDCYLTVKNPKLSILVDYQAMTFISNGEFNYELAGNLLQDLGDYPVTLSCSDSADYLSSSFYFEVSKSGSKGITSGEGGMLMLSIVVMLVISTLFFIFGLKTEMMGLKVVLIGTAGILLIATLLFSLVGVEQILGRFDNITEGFATFWFVVKVITGIAILGITLFAGYLALKVWQIKRGYRDW